MTFIIMLFILLIKRWLRVAGPREPAVEPLLLGGATCLEAGPRSCAQVGAATQDPKGRRGSHLHIESARLCSSPPESRLSAAQRAAQPVTDTQASSVKKKKTNMSASV